MRWSTCSLAAALILLRGSSAPAAPRPTMPEGEFEALAAKVVKLYEENESLWRQKDLKAAERQKRSRDIMMRAAHLQQQIAQGGRTFNRSKAYRAWQDRQAAAARQRRLLQLRKHLAVANDDEWAVLRPRIDAVLRLRDDLSRAESRCALTAPADDLNRLRIEQARPKADKKRLRELLDAVRASRARARADADTLRANLTRAQNDLIAILTIEQEAVLVIHEVLD